ncbi:hypothetical protein FYJ43_00245 [Cutibacterium sp. WCA-380-WT-3A]|uniref:Uncharacterized protein n=1 Tax=Cutibacterium porci TaxID=2605781 RepID=A0A7K0J3M0_9ACTN|nr:hypothetical protein [Cutibacterium porci]
MASGNHIGRNYIYVSCPQLVDNPVDNSWRHLAETARYPALSGDLPLAVSSMLQHGATPKYSAPHGPGGKHHLVGGGTRVRHGPL